MRWWKPRRESEAKPPVYKGIPGIMCEKEGLLFKNARINGQPVEVSKCIYGEIEEAGMPGGWFSETGSITAPEKAGNGMKPLRSL